MMQIKNALLLYILMSVIVAINARADVNIVFDPDSVTVTEGTSLIATVLCDDTGDNEAPTVIVIDSTGFTSAHYDTTSEGGPDDTTRVILTIEPRFTDSGLYGIDIIAYDNLGGVADSSLPVYVVDSLRPPEFINLPDSVTIYEGQSASFPAVATDPDGDILSYSMEPSDSDWVQIVDTNGLISIGPVPYTIATWENQNSVVEFSVIVIDDSPDLLADTSTFKIKVNNVDRPPYFTTPSRDTLLTIYQEQEDSLTFRAADPDAAEGDSVAFFDLDNIVAGLTGQGWIISFADSVLIFTPPADSSGLVDPVGWRFLAARDDIGSPGDTTIINFIVLDTIPEGGGPPNIIDTMTLDYHNSTIFNPQTDSFYVTFEIDQTANFILTISDQLMATVYSVDDSLTAGTYSYGWDGVMNTGPGAGQMAVDGRYTVAFSARTYPVSPYDFPIQVGLILDSYAPFEMSFFPNSRASGEQARIITNQTKFVLVVGDTGAVGINTRADIINPYLEYGTPETMVFTEVDSIPGQWEADLSQRTPLATGDYEMTLVIAERAGNENRYQKYYQVTEDTGITGFLNYPNPFAPSGEVTRVAYVLGQSVGDLRLEIFDASGDLVFRVDLDGTFLSAGPHEYSWDGKSSWGKILNNGVYYARLNGGITTEFLKIAIVDR